MVTRIRRTLLASTFLFLICVLVYSIWWNSTISILFGNLSELLLLFVAGWGMLQTGWQFDDPIRKRPWQLFALGMYIWSLGQLMEIYCNVILVRISYATITDAFWLLGYCLISIGLFQLRADLRTSVADDTESSEFKLPEIQKWIVSALPVVYIPVFLTLIFPLLTDQSRTFSQKLLDFTYPTADFLLFAFLLTCFVEALRFRIRSLNHSLLLLAGGFAYSMLADLSLSHVQNFNSPLYKILSLAYIPAYACYALSGAHRPGMPKKETAKALSQSDSAHLLRTESLSLNRIRGLLEMIRKAHTTDDLQEALRILLREALELTELDRGFIMLFNEQGSLEFCTGCNKAGATLNAGDFQVSNSLIQKSLTERKLFRFRCWSDPASESAKQLGIIEGFSIPLFACRSFYIDQSHTEIIGILYLDTRTKNRFEILSDEEDLMNSLALHVGLAVENARLFQLATLDALTRIYQRRYFDHVMAVEWKRSVRYGRPLSVMILDVDHFKRINDTYGHHQGDNVLRQAASRLKCACRAGDIVARYGGEEFAVLLPETDLDGAMTVANRIQKFAHQEFSGIRSPVTFSIGLAATPPCFVTRSEELIRFADAALYSAKRKGRNRLETCDSANPTSDYGPH
jgi:diguanylate cyclase (GGDEF)-like protein